MKIIERPQYMEALLGAKGTPDIKVITGIRRCGKSVLLEALADRFREADPDANIIRINFNLLEFEELTDYRALHRYVEEGYCEGLDNIVMIDEVQTCVGFEKWSIAFMHRENTISTLLAPTLSCFRVIWRRFFAGGHMRLKYFRFPCWSFRHITKFITRTKRLTDI